jgi:hypothetical protein
MPPLTHLKVDQTLAMVAVDLPKHHMVQVLDKSITRSSRDCLSDQMRTHHLIKINMVNFPTTVAAQLRLEINVNSEYDHKL